MKKSEFRNLINECVREVLAEEKAKKKQLAKKKIEEIINEAELTKEDLNEFIGKLVDKAKEAVKTKYEEGSVEGDENVKKDAEAKIKAFMDEKGTKLDAATKTKYTKDLEAMIPAAVKKAASFKKPVIIKVEIAKGKPILTVGGAKAVGGAGSIFTGSGSTGGQTAYGE